MAIDARTLVKDVALAGPAALALLDEWRIDYCCRGGETLGRACVAAGVDPSAAVARLKDAASEARAASEWGRRGVVELVDVIVGTCHPATRAAIAHVDDLLAGEPRSRREWRPLRDAFDRVASLARSQMEREDDRHYAHARALARARNGRGPWPDAPLGELHARADEIRAEHARTHAELRELRRIAESVLAERDDARDLLAAVRALHDRLTWQMHLENNLLLPQALDLEPEPSR